MTGDTGAPTELEQLGQRVFAAREMALSSVADVVVDPAVPIMYFGDLRGYQESPVRVVTVGLNPSHEEFPTGSPFERFPSAADLKGFDLDRYFEALDEYFVREPYRSWFSTFEPILNGLGSSYYPGRDSFALHTDLCSPIATDPTWSRLHPPVRSRLIESGKPLWHELVRYLRPNVILVSVARHHLDGIDFPVVEEPREFYRIERSRPYVVTGWHVRVAPDVRALLVFGQAAQRPFGKVSGADKRALGEAIGKAVLGSS